jgi:hypothetical protein
LAKSRGFGLAKISRTTFHYDITLHAVFLGFVFAMIFAHAPVIFPLVFRRPPS